MTSTTSIRFDAVAEAGSGRVRAAPSFLRRTLRARLAPFWLAICGLVLLAAIAAPLVAPYNPVKVDSEALLDPPSRTHVLGTDQLGRDILSRMIYGAQASLAAGLASVAAALVIGTAIGVVSGYLGHSVDNVAMRLMDTLLSFPALLLALSITVVLGAGLTAVIIAISIVYIPTFARLARGQVLSARELDFVLAARAIGVPDVRIMLRHILPNIAAPLIVQASLSIAFAILTEASLSFLGLGIKPPEPSWGSMVSEGRQYLREAPWVVFGPGGAILVTVMALNVLGDALRDALDVRLSA